MADDTMPTVGTYRGIPLHDFQSRERIERVVCPEIDQVLAMGDDVRRLAAFAGDVSRSPEARLAAGRRIQAMASDAAGRHRAISNVDIASVGAQISGLGSLTWADPTKYGTLFEGDPPAGHGGPRAARRPPEYVEALQAVLDERRETARRIYQAGRRS